MNILSYNPGHDGAIAYLKDGHLIFSIETEKDSNYRYSPVSSPDVFRALGELDEIPDVICAGGWWPNDHYEYMYGSSTHAGYRGESKNDIIADLRRFLGKSIH
jgi:predicted NodU family carbamoyl transferase